MRHRTWWAEIIDGTLYTHPRPGPQPIRRASSGTWDLNWSHLFHFGRGGPGGWWILDEPETPSEPRHCSA